MPVSVNVRPKPSALKTYRNGSPANSSSGNIDNCCSSSNNNKSNNSTRRSNNNVARWVLVRNKILRGQR
jgi:hypothetical protein